MSRVIPIIGERVWWSFFEGVCMGISNDRTQVFVKYIPRKNAKPRIDAFDTEKIHRFCECGGKIEDGGTQCFQCQQK